MTFGKGGYLVSGLFVACYIGYRLVVGIIKQTNKKNAILIVSFIAVVGTTLFALYYRREFGVAVDVHFYAIEATFNNIIKNPFGYGIGIGGNAASIFSFNGMKDWLSTGGETALLSFVYQLGIQGLLLLLMCLVCISGRIRNGKYNTRFAECYSFIPLIIIGVSIFQDNTFTPQCITLFMLMAGILSN